VANVRWDRQALRDAAEHRVFDLLVIGGGITGAGILLDAQVRGLQSCLVEMQDFAAGTSSRSTKLVHGGLRYLKQFEIGLVAEVGREREIVYENAPHVTTPVWMLLPIVEGGSMGNWTASFGLFVYDRLAGVKHAERRRMLSAKEALAAEPLLNPTILKGAGHYVEYRTDDARLTIEVLKAAVARGAVASNYAKVVDFLRDGNHVVGARVQDVLTGESFEVRARLVVNAAGPWVDTLRELDGSKFGKTVHWTKGVHVVVDGARFPLRSPVYFDTPDGRMVFAIPRAGKTYIGTTDTDFSGDLQEPRMAAQDLHYLLAATTAMFPTIQLQPSDVESSWAGVRPLIHEEGKSPSEISRKDEVFVSNSGLVSIAGGKLTGYRKMAEKVVDLAIARLPQSGLRPACTTDRIPLSGGDFGGASRMPAFVADAVLEGRALGMTPAQAEELVHRYGTNVAEVFAYVRTDAQEADELGLSPHVYAQVRYGMDAEAVQTPADFFVRRTGALYFDIASVRRWREPVCELMHRYMKWDTARRAACSEELDRLLQAAVEPLQAATGTAVSQGRV
jgi:glycerol-3-phosphate dehydrogenase